MYNAVQYFATNGCFSLRRLFSAGTQRKMRLSREVSSTELFLRLLFLTQFLEKRGTKAYHSIASVTFEDFCSVMYIILKWEKRVVIIRYSIFIRHLDTVITPETIFKTQNSTVWFTHTNIRIGSDSGVIVSLYYIPITKITEMSDSIT